ncbi:MAG: c-type cytochrome [Verrucomicrobiaceae bacterium]|nr:c-type cytochrome [Verrucomicrobiaceae bacterium]
MKRISKATRAAFVLFSLGAGLSLVPALRAQQTIFSAPERGAVTEKIPTVPATPPDRAAATFEVLDGFRMDLLAAEPLLASPVAMVYDENGRAYVCEMRDYPYTDKAKHKPGQENPTDAAIGRIRLLEDLDGDGVFDKATVFAEDLSWPTGVACWKGGVFVAATPDIWYLKDTDGDGVADQRTKVFTGFRKLNVQAVMNNLVWGLDNRIHGAGGSNGGRISRVGEEAGDAGDAAPDEIAMARADFRIDPRDFSFGLQAGGARFGGSFDDWGHRFLCNIRNPAQHIVLPTRYLDRNPALLARSSLHDMAESGDQLRVYSISPPEPWRVIRAERWAGERDIIMPRSELVGAGVVTSASGITSYRGSAYPEKYRGNVFVAECAGNLFYRLRLTPDGVSFRADRVDGEAEIVASTDNWFRPVNFYNAPDGTLHVLDMYRENIEHPWSIPEDIHAAVDLEAGREMGRLWRLTPPGFQPVAPPRLGEATTAELVATLERPDSWWRETAQRLLFERQDPAAVPLLKNLVHQSPSALARLHALWTLHGLDALEKNERLAALRDASPGVRENAIRLAEPHLQDPDILEAVLPLADAPEARVRFQAAFTLGESDDPRAFAALTRIALRDGADPWIRSALLSSTAETGGALLAALLRGGDAADTAELIRELSQTIGIRNDSDEISGVFAALQDRDLDDPVLREFLFGIGDGLRRSGKSLRGQPYSAGAARVIATLLDEARHRAAAPSSDAGKRIFAIRLLAFDEFATVADTLSGLLGSGETQDIKIAAVQTLDRFSDAGVVPRLLDPWTAQTPAVRSEIITAMTRVAARALPLLQAIEADIIPAHQVPFAQRRFLTRHRDEQVKELAAKHFTDPARSPRREIIQTYLPALETPGDPVKGKAVFEATCIICHRAGDLGDREVGPNLANIRSWSPEQILINTLDPNREVAANFLAYQVEDKNGRVLYGMIAEESESALQLIQADGIAENVLRRDIAGIRGSGLSLMPDGFEAAISPESMADLIAFLRED